CQKKNTLPLSSQSHSLTDPGASSAGAVLSSLTSTSEVSVAQSRAAIQSHSAKKAKNTALLGNVPGYAWLKATTQQSKTRRKEKLDKKENSRAGGI
ncbi:hypothetical protein J007_05315, partial [Cryptococcus neoformans]